MVRQKYNFSTNGKVCAELKHSKNDFISTLNTFLSTYKICFY